MWSKTVAFCIGMGGAILGGAALLYWWQLTRVIGDPTTATMKMPTAICILISGIMIALMGRKPIPKHYHDPVISALALFVGAFMGLYLGDAMSGEYVLNIGPELPGMAKTVAPNTPSVGSMLAFMAIAAAGYAGGTTEVPWWKLALPGVFTGLIGLGALIGAAYHIPALYWWLPPYSSGIAIPTAYALLAFGVAIVTIACDRRRGIE